jgi:hypothetical protein
MTTMSTEPTLCQGELNEISRVLGQHSDLDSKGIREVLEQNPRLRNKMEKIGAYLVKAPTHPKDDGQDDVRKEVAVLSAKCVDRAIELCAAAFSRAASTGEKFHVALQAEFKAAEAEIPQQQNFDRKWCLAADQFWATKLGIL